MNPHAEALDPKSSVYANFTTLAKLKGFEPCRDRTCDPQITGTLGILTDPSHPLFREFPTEEHTNWQWFPVLKASRPMILDALEGYKPIVQVIDNVERNHRLGLVFEFQVGKGKLLVCCSDLESILEYPEGRQFYKAVLDYMRSDDFQPSVTLDRDRLKL